MRRYATALVAVLCACPAKEQPAPPPTSVAAPDPAPEPDKVPDAPTGPVVTEASKAAHAFVAQRMFGGPLPASDLVHYTPIEDPGGQALDHFHSALGKLAAAKDQTKVRVAVYGSSSVANDRYTAYLRGYLQHRFGDAGVGFVAVVPLWRWHRHNAVRVKASKHWLVEHAQRKKTGRLDGRYGLLGASAYSTNKRAFTTVSAKTSALSDPAGSTMVQLQYLAQPGGGSFTLTHGSNKPATIATAAKDYAPAFHETTFGPDKTFAAHPLPLKISPVGNGEVRLFGAVLERQGPGVVVDSLGVGGTRAANMLDWDVSLWGEALRRRPPDLYILAYGGNESVDEDEPIDVYRDNLGKVLDILRQSVPQASCVLVGPVDFPMKELPPEGEPPPDEPVWVPRPRVAQIIETQREVARQKGCGFFDERALMGGEGSMNAWVAAEPPLAKRDHLHLTKLGYLKLGEALVDTLMAGFDARR